MSISEMLEWMAYDMSQSQEFKDKMALEKQRAATAEEQLRAFKDYFQGK